MPQSHHRPVIPCRTFTTHAHKGRENSPVIRHPNKSMRSNLPKNSAMIEMMDQRSDPSVCGDAESRMEAKQKCFVQAPTTLEKALVKKNVYTRETFSFVKTLI